MSPVRRVVLDVLKPREPALHQFAAALGDVEGVAGVVASVVELDDEVQNVSVTVEGADVDVAGVEAAVEELGGAVHSVDEVACGDLAGEGRR